MNTSSEKQPSATTYEHSPSEDLEKAAHERREVLREAHERASEQPHEKADDARREALEKAQSIEKLNQKTAEKVASPAEKRADRVISQKDRDTSFTATMEDAQTHMSPTSRTFSHIIHNKAVEKVSDATGSTIARPNAILSGSIAAFILTLALYLVAKNLGYTLSGFETIGAFIIGWVLGIAFDFLKIMVTGRK